MHSMYDLDLPMVAGEGLNPKRYAADVPPQTLSEAIHFCTQYWTRTFPDSLPTYLRHLREFAKWAHQHLAHPLWLIDINQHVLARYRFWLVNRPKQGGGTLSGASVQLKLSTVAAMFKVLVDQGFVKENPIRRIETTRTRRQRLQRESFEELRLPIEALQELLAQPFDEAGYWGLRNKVLLHTLAFWGLRPIELTWMTPANLYKSTFSFDRAKHNYPGSFWVPDEFRDWIADMEFQYGVSPNKPLFIGQYKTGITVKGIQRIVKKYGEQVGVPNLTPKDFRICVETYMDQNYEEIERDKYMGYVPPGTARKYYVKVPKTVIQRMFDTWVEELHGE